MSFSRFPSLHHGTIYRHIPVHMYTCIGAYTLYVYVLQCMYVYVYMHRCKYTMQKMYIKNSRNIQVERGKIRDQQISGRR